MTEAENPQFRKFGRVLDGAAAQEERMEEISADSRRETFRFNWGGRQPVGVSEHLHFLIDLFLYL